MADENIDIEIQARANRIRELKKSEVWEKDLEPKIVQTLVDLETQFCSTKDINQRYALVESYTTIKEFKLWIDELAEMVV